MTPPADPTRLLAALRLIASALDAAGVPWALVGGLAVSVRAEPRFTRDIDIAVAVSDDAAAEALVSRLTALRFRLHLSLEQQALGRLAAVRLLAPGEREGGVVVDLLFASSGIEPDICREADRIEVTFGLVAPVARVGHLMAMKVLALQALRTVLTPDDRERAIAAVARIEQVGAHRGKSLRVDVRRLRTAAPPRCGETTSGYNRPSIRPPCCSASLRTGIRIEGRRLKADGLTKGPNHATNNALPRSARGHPPAGAATCRLRVP